MKKTQESIIVKKLLSDGKVSRNWALQNFISRLGSIICNLNQSGWVIKGGYVKENGGKNYYYTVIKAPYKKVIYHIEGRGDIIAHESI